MGKRISRRELIQKIKDLKVELNITKLDKETAERDRDELKKRFTALGSQVETFDARGSGIECIEIKPETYGNYCLLGPEAELSDELTEAIKTRLATGIAKGLLEFNRVQIIIKDDDIFGQKTIAAKLYVVPWDKMARKLIVKC